MGSRGRHIEVFGLDKWIDGLDKFDEPDEEDLKRWNGATRFFFDKTQTAVHIDSRALQKSGRWSSSRVGHTLIGEVEYGGTPAVDYAIYEFRRGGEHDALNRGFVMAKRTFEAVLAEILVEKVNRWR
jgi:hypothetical protein